jgi:hypothetical protein
MLLCDQVAGHLVSISLGAGPSRCSDVGLGGRMENQDQRRDDRCQVHEPASREQHRPQVRAGATPAICIVDMTGFAFLTEEQGDETAARL